MHNSLKILFARLTAAIAVVAITAAFLIAPVKVNAYSAGDVVTFTGTLVTSSAPYDHAISGKNIKLIIGSQYDSLLNQTVDLKVTYTSPTHFVVSSITASSSPPAAPPVSTFVQYSRTFTGTLQLTSDPVYRFTLSGMNIRLVLNSGYNSWVGNTVSVNVTYTSAGHFVVNSVTKI